MINQEKLKEGQNFFAQEPFRTEIEKVCIDPDIEQSIFQRLLSIFSSSYAYYGTDHLYEKMARLAPTDPLL